MKQTIILPGQKTLGWPSQRARRLNQGTHAEILSTAWREDVHFVQYAVIEGIGPYRYNNEVLRSPEYESYKNSGGYLELVVVAFDIDSPAKKSGEPGAIDIWWEEERGKIARLLERHPGGYIWRTKGGWRGVWYTSYPIVTPDDAANWRKDYLSAVVYLERAFGIIADPACSDWNRLHRVPFGIREGEEQFGWGEPERRETIGRLEGSFDVPAASSDADRQEARRRHLSAWKTAAPKRTAEARADQPTRSHVVLEGQGVWERYLRSRGAVIRELAPGKYAVRCPNEAAHSSVNDTSTILFSPGPGEVLGHLHCAHHHCQGLDFRQAWGVSDEEWSALVREVVSELPKEEGGATTVAGGSDEGQEDPSEAERRVVSQLIPGKDGMPAPIPHNVAHLLLHHPSWKGKLAFDTFLHERYWLQMPDVLKPIHTLGGGRWDKRVLDLDAGAIQAWLWSFDEIRPRIMASIETVREGMRIASRANSYDSLRDYVLSFDGVWDGTPRLDTWLHDYMGADDTTLNRVIGKKWLIAAMARALDPGCVADMMLILEGLQGVGKNLMLETLFGQEFLVVPQGLKLGSKDFVQKIQGSWVVHDDELSCLLAAGLDDAKAWLSFKKDKFRKAYETDFVEAERRFVIVGSTNRANYLHDTENRRIWPVLVRGLQLTRLEKERTQLLSEALAYYNTRTPWTIRRDDPVWDVLNEEHHKRSAYNPWEEPVRTAMNSGTINTPFVMAQVFDTLSVPIERRTNAAMQQIARVLRELGLERRMHRSGTKGPRHYLWYSVDEYIAHDGTKWVKTQ